LTGGCGNISTTGSITVTANNTVSLTSATNTDAQTLCISTPITNITYSTTGATGATVSGLPTGVSGNWSSNTVTISGTPSVSGTFNYTVTLTGGCGNISTTGSITVTANNTISLTSGSSTQTVCTAITPIVYNTTGATGATYSGLPTGVSGDWDNNVVTISGTPSVSGTFNYTVTLTGGCGTVTANGTITSMLSPLCMDADAVNFCMIAVPGGTTRLPTIPLSGGADVTISNFYIGEHEVTQALWLAVMSSFTQTQNRNYDTGDNVPVYYVSWNDIVGVNTGGGSYTAKGVTYYDDGFCYKLSELVGGGNKFRLPTEAEWEYAAKGGQQTHNWAYSGKELLSEVPDVAWCYENTTVLEGIGVRTVGTRYANELGIYDMSGNVWEWCSDYWGCNYPNGSSDPACTTSSSNRVLRGGSWGSSASYCSVSYRDNFAPADRHFIVGFRLVLFF
jgi:formylglycine-generating enzyme required for sulfatase activity